MNCESLSDWGRGALSCSPPQSICVPSQGLYRSSCLIRLRWHCRLLLCTAAESVSSSGLLTEAAVAPTPADAAEFPFGSSQSFGVGKKKKKSFSCGNKNMSTLIHVKKRLYPCPWRACVSVRQLMCVSVSVCVMSCLNCLLCWYFTIDLMTKAEHYTLSVE